MGAALAGHGEKIGRLLTLEQGKVLKWGVMEGGWPSMMHKQWLAYDLPVQVIADDEKNRVEVHQRPLGVVAAIIPWLAAQPSRENKANPSPVGGSSFSCLFLCVPVWRVCAYTHTRAHTRVHPSIRLPAHPSAYVVVRAHLSMPSLIARVSAGCVIDKWTPAWPGARPCRNYPLAIAFAKIYPALLAGNAVIVKASPFTPLTMCMIAEILADAVPPGLFQVLPGGDEVGRGLVAHPGGPALAMPRGSAPPRPALPWLS